MSNEMVRLMHGSGIGLNTLLHEVVLPALNANPDNKPLEDAAIIAQPRGPIAFTTDSFVVNPLRFCGGDIGKLAACGTINDLAMMGARATHISVGLIIEEGLPFSELRDLLGSLRSECEKANVLIACGDTKVVDAGKGDGLYINTSGIGSVRSGLSLSAAHAREGDCVIVSGPIAQHGIAIMTARGKLGFATGVSSDCAPLHEPALALLDAVPATRVMRDATRGGCAAVLNEIADDSGVTITLDDTKIPVAPAVRSACDYLGLDPLQVANEGRFVAVLPSEAAPVAIEVLNKYACSQGAAVIGTVGKRGRFGVLLKTSIGGVRPLEVPAGQLLPRIC